MKKYILAIVVLGAILVVAGEPNIVSIKPFNASTNGAAISASITNGPYNGVLEAIYIDLPAATTGDFSVVTANAVGNPLRETLYSKTDVSADVASYLRRIVFHDATGTSIPTNTVIAFAEPYVLASQSLIFSATNSTGATAKEIRFYLKFK